MGISEALILIQILSFRADALQIQLDIMKLNEASANNIEVIEIAPVGVSSVEVYGLTTEGEKPEITNEFSEKSHIETILKTIAECESGNRQFNKDGEPLWNSQGSSAVGVLQIMYSIHGEDARARNLDIINSYEDNWEYGRILFKQHGTKPWEADPKSYNCWK